MTPEERTEFAGDIAKAINGSSGGKAKWWPVAVIGGILGIAVVAWGAVDSQVVTEAEITAIEKANEKDHSEMREFIAAQKVMNEHSVEIHRDLKDAIKVLNRNLKHSAHPSRRRDMADIGD